jgi:hypothetical protein
VCSLSFWAAPPRQYCKGCKFKVTSQICVSHSIIIIIGEGKSHFSNPFRVEFVGGRPTAGLFGKFVYVPAEAVDVVNGCNWVN